MFKKIMEGTVLVAAYWLTLSIGFRAGVHHAYQVAERKQLKRENEELKKQLHSKKES